MPVYHSRCTACGNEFEWSKPRMTVFDFACPSCRGRTERLYFPLAAIWTKPLVAYADKNRETYRKDLRAGGHVIFEKNSDAAQAAGRPLKRVIRTVQDQRDYCKAEGVMMPSDMPSNLSVAADGKSYETNNISEI